MVLFTITTLYFFLLSFSIFSYSFYIYTNIHKYIITITVTVNHIPTRRNHPYSGLTHPLPPVTATSGHSSCRLCSLMPLDRGNRSVGSTYNSASCCSSCRWRSSLAETWRSSCTSWSECQCSCWSECLAA